MHYKDIPIESGDQIISVNLKKPEYPSKLGIVDLHGALGNKETKSREGPSYSGDISDYGTWVINPDLPGGHGKSKIDKKRSKINFKDLLYTVDVCVDYLIERGVEKIGGSGNSMGAIIMNHAALENEKIISVSNANGPELSKMKDAEYIGPVLNFASEYFPDLKFPTFLFKNKRYFGQNTLNYISDVMMKDPQYESDTYPTFYPAGFFNDLLKQKTYEPLIESEKPNQVIFGKQDKVTENWEEYDLNGLNVIHVPDSDHITICRKDEERKKISDLVGPFFVETLI